MGCTSSNETATNSPAEAPDLSPAKVVRGTCTEFVPMRTNAKSTLNLYDNFGPRSFPLDGPRFSYCLTYCCASQRGYYPDALRKANQDSFLACEKLMDDPNCFLFAVFDGHGPTGDACSWFCAQNFRRHLVSQIERYARKDAVEDPLAVLDDEESLNRLYKAAFNGVNHDLHSCEIDDSLSGTTGISVIVHGDELHVGNVGDSRAIIGTYNSRTKRMRFSTLSNDQTPFRKDERDRLRKCGAEVLSMDQIEGLEVKHDRWGEDGFESEDPPRVWNSTLQIPGCGFTRSLGDAVGEAVGVCSDPEVLSWHISGDDRFVIIASDGVFEFLNSEVVLDIIHRVIERTGDLAQAVKVAISEAFRLWNNHDERTDDITMILLSLDEFVGKRKARQRRGSTVEHTGTVNKRLAVALEDSKVEEIKSKWSRKMEKFDIKKHTTKKSPSQSSQIDYYLSISQLFMALTDTQREALASVMNRREVGVDQEIIGAGAAVSSLYILDSGEVAVFKNDNSNIKNRVCTYTAPGTIFGELGLIYNTPSELQMVAATSCVLWTVTKEAFRAIIADNKKRLSTKDLDEITLIFSS